MAEVDSILRYREVIVKPFGLPSAVAEVMRGPNSERRLQAVECGIVIFARYAD